jgi:signal transduction histidine kinase
MEGNVRDAAHLRARDLVSSLEEGQAPSSLVNANDDDVLIQIVDGSGAVIAASPSLQGDPPIARLDSGSSQIIDHPAGDDDPFVLWAQRADSSAGPVTVLVGRNLDLVRETIATTTRALLTGIPILLLIVGLTTWAVVGRSLAPVESMRREVEHITATELHRRVPDPQGQDEIARLAHTMNEMLARLDEAQARQQQLVSDASHELRNPIAAIRQYAEVAIEHPERTTLGDLAAGVLTEDLRLQRLADDLLLLARADEHTLQLNAQPVDVDDLMLEEAARLKQSTDLRIDTSGVAAARTLGDRGQLSRVVSNLCDNAARHAISVVRLAGRVSNGQVVLEIDDDGAGIPPESRAAIFERFTRLDGARDRRHGGAGLGLSIVHEIVTAHGGVVSADDSPLGGARFIVRLPAHSS